MMKKHIGTLLILVGIIVIAVPLIGRYVATQKQEKLMETFLEQNTVTVESVEYEDLNASLDWGSQSINQTELDEGAEGADATVNDEAIVGIITEGPSEANVLEDAGKIIKKPDTVALLEISKIDVYLPVAEGTDQATLKYALGHMPETAAIGAVGNAVVAGHRGHSFGTYFSRLDEIVIGDEIKVTAGGKTYIYEVYETLIVEPNDLSVLRGSSAHQVLTLITCHPMYTSTHRLIVHAVIRD